MQNLDSLEKSLSRKLLKEFTLKHSLSQFCVLFSFVEQII